MSRHGKPADDSARLNLVVPKIMKGQIAEAKKVLRVGSLSDCARHCLAVGLEKILKGATRNEVV